MTIAEGDTTPPHDGSQLLHNLLLFGRLLQHAGLRVHAGRMLDVVEALGHVHLGERDEVYHACRALLVHRREQLVTFDRVFAAFWRDHHHADPRSRERATPAAASVLTVTDALELDGVGATSANDAVDAEPSGVEDAEGDASRRRAGIKAWSDRGGRADKDFALFTSDEIVEAHHLLSRLIWN
ncbi:MAG: hypothetical protein M3478_05970, partial [Planctomycetota bacterium]|nr:hypothetical protein [Planctomycetota bacterium]